MTGISLKRIMNALGQVYMYSDMTEKEYRHHAGVIKSKVIEKTSDSFTIPAKA